ncbi:NAD(P)-dependent oxidoreductase [Streptomyces sp. TP-A0356]|uniref:NAD-dependent epimerase/dehydratase family protein n=1 Tax=Streptomyces sp. TP-A0356 TaxID=1359208 RepID=UPI0006E1727F|nr:NAD-dependent epimerase/dehydratase family protein [Streptomyces sp. TP-A0356]
MTVVGAQGLPGRPDMRSGRVVVLGATGFVGRHVGAALEAAGHQVLAVARRPVKTPPSWHFHPMDLVNDGPAALTQLIEAERPVAVVNAAGEVWSRSAGDMRQSNQLLVDRLLAALGATTQRPRLVHLGSVHEYSPQATGVALAEDSPTHPTTAYGRSKLDVTRAVLRSTEEGLTQAVVLRLSNVVGAGTPPASLLGRVAQQLLAASGSDAPAVVRVSPLRSSRDFVDAKDVSEAVVAAMRSARAVGRVVNIGSGTSQHVRAMVDLLIATSGRAARLVEGTGGTVRPVTDTDWMGVDVSAARELLGWSPRRTPQDMVRDLWEAAADNAE